MCKETFKSFWYGSSLTAREKLCLKSFVERGKQFELYTYDKSLSVPEGVILKDASEIYPKDKVFKYKKGPGKGSVAVFANFFRYKLLYERGGWWVDTDVIYTGEKTPSAEVYLGWANDSFVGNSIMKFTEKHDIIEEMHHRSKSMGKKEASKEWGKSGPKLLTNLIKEKRNEELVKELSYAFPITWRNVEELYLPDLKSELENRVGKSPFVHLFNEVLGRMGVHKNVCPPKGSFLYEQAEKLNFDWPCEKVEYSSEMIRQVAKNWRKARKEKWKNLELQKIKSSNTWKVLSKINNLRRKFGI